MPSSKSFVARHRNGAFYTLGVVLVAALGTSAVAALANNLCQAGFAASDARLDEARGGEQRALIFPDAKSFEKVSVPSIEGLNGAYATDAGDYVFDVQADGYAGPVQLMVGVASDGTIAGIQVVADNETDGIGTNALTDDYLATYAGQAASGVLTVEEAGSGETHVDGVSGATFTSKGVVAAVNVAIEAFAELGGN